ncbi:MAG: polymer-forming cytoskeletal protein [candidate division WOR-3 bacterium]|nr:polymer-forming cytoskeletal protein [candidate division WOR-3 bacterium]
MQGIVAIILLFIQMSGPSSLDANNESIPFAGWMPEVVVTARRYSEEDDKPLCVRDAVYRDGESYASYADFDMAPLLAYAEPDNEPDFLLCGTTIGGDFIVSEEDTVREDVTVKGGNAEIDGLIEGDLAVMGGKVDVNGMIDGDVAVFGGNLDIFGKITGDAAIFGGNIHNKGTIEGDLFVVGGGVSLDSGSVVGGDISTVGGSVDRDENASVGGKIESLELGKINKVLPRITRALRWRGRFPEIGIFTKLFSVSGLIVIYILGLLVLLIFSKAIYRVVNKIQGSVWVSVASGIGIEILFVPLIVLFAVSIIGIPIIPLFILAILVAMLFGFSASSVTIGERIKESLNWQTNNRIGIFSLGWVAIMIIPIVGLFVREFGFVGSLIFFLGLAILYVTITIGLGAVIYALIKRER